MSVIRAQSREAPLISCEEVTPTCTGILGDYLHQANSGNARALLNTQPLHKNRSQSDCFRPRIHKIHSTEARLRSSSEKFSRNVRCKELCCSVVPSGYSVTANRFPFGANA